MNCNYFYKPTIKIPDILIYHVPAKNFYRMINVKEHFIVGEMISFPRKKNLLQKELWIDALAMRINHRNQGYGKIMLDFAQNLSKKLGFKGRLGAIAATIEQTSHIPPHKFYRKYGFVAKDKKITKFLDECIQNGTLLDYTVTPPVEMHFSPRHKSNNLCCNILNKLKCFY